MSLTETEEVFGSTTEAGINDLLSAFFTARPRHLNYGSPGFVPATTVAATQIGAIPFPGVPGGIDWAVQLSIPRVDLHPETDSLPPELSLSAGQLSVATTVRLCVACETKREREPDPDRTEHPHDPDHRPDDKPVDDRPPGKAKGTCFELKVFAVAHMERTFSPDGVVVAVDAVEIVDIEPIALESVLECLILQILRAVLADVELPLETLRAGAFSLSLTRGPEVENDQLEVYGNL
ncbi:MAG TPA: hypothetical protein VFL72_03210 [Acidimicrobiia bacterium]|nr:hypothetical protein [Acidimicrobiia bacterium]